MGKGARHNNMHSPSASHSLQPGVGRENGTEKFPKGGSRQFQSLNCIRKEFFLMRLPLRSATSRIAQFAQYLKESIWLPPPSGPLQKCKKSEVASFFNMPNVALYRAGYWTFLCLTGGGTSALLGRLMSTCIRVEKSPDHLLIRSVILLGSAFKEFNAGFA